MALYVGNQKLKININGIIYCLNLYSEKPITNGVLLLSNDNYILKDSNGLYITTKESD